MLMHVYSKYILFSVCLHMGCLNVIQNLLFVHLFKYFVNILCGIFFHFTKGFNVFFLLTQQFPIVYQMPLVRTCVHTDMHSFEIYGPGLSLFHHACYYGNKYLYFNISRNSIWPPLQVILSIICTSNKT